MIHHRRSISSILHWLDESVYRALCMQVQDNRGTLNNGCSVQLQQNLVPISLLTRVMPQSTILVGKLTAQHRKNPFILSKLWASYKYSALRCSYGRRRFKSGVRCSNSFFYIFLLIFNHSDFHKMVKIFIYCTVRHAWLVPTVFTKDGSLRTHFWHMY